VPEAEFWGSKDSATAGRGRGEREETARSGAVGAKGFLDEAIGSADEAGGEAADEEPGGGIGEDPALERPTEEGHAADGVGEGERDAPSGHLAGVVGGLGGVFGAGWGCGGHVGMVRHEKARPIRDARRWGHLALFDREGRARERDDAADPLATASSLTTAKCAICLVDCTCVPPQNSTESFAPRGLVGRIEQVAHGLPIETTRTGSGYVSPKTARTPRSPSPQRAGRRRRRSGQL
jgi:hypothetical protein